MSLRRLLLLAFSAVALPPAALMMLLAFWQTERIVHSEIQANLAAQAESVSAKLRQMLFERTQNAITWSELEIMQDVAVDDVDKRLSAFLADSQRRYADSYRALHVVDSGGVVIASSDPQRIGRTFPAGARCAGGSFELVLCTPRPDDAQQHAMLSIRLRSRFDGAALGRLLLVIDWDSVGSVLDAASGAHRAAAVFEPDGARIASSRGWQRMTGEVAAHYLTASARTEPIPGLPGTAWRTRIQQSRDSALAPIRRMALAFVGLLVLAGILIVLVATLVSARVARPLVELSGYARALGQGGAEKPPALLKAPSEVDALREALARMVADLESQRQKLVLAAKLAAVGEFAAVMAHEIRTPLGILRSSAQTIDADRLDAQSRELVGYILSETERLNRLVNALLDSTRTRAPQAVAQDFEALVERGMAMVGAQAREKDIRLSFERGAADPVVEVDGEQMLQVLLNLLLNAIQILPRGGSIRLSTRDDADSLRLRVHDDGPGILEAEHEQIFEPFVHRREGGLGIGLAVVREITRAHGGDVRVMPTEAGACFEVRLPRSARVRA